MVRNANNFKRRTKLKTITKNNHQKKKKFSKIFFKRPVF